MGVDYNVYVGPYIRLQNAKVNKTFSVRGCKKCKTYVSNDDVNFCAKCGAPLENYNKKVEVDLFGWELTEQLDDNFYFSNPEDARDILIPNNDEFGTNIDVKCETKTIPLDEDFIKGSILEFKNQYEDELKTLDELAPDQYEIEFGVVAYHS